MTNFQVRYPKILVVGDPMLDTYVLGSVLRLSPEAPIPVLLKENSLDKAGGAANVALNISAFTPDCTFAFPTSNDDASLRLVGILNHTPLKCIPISLPNYRTPHKTRFITKQHQLLRLDCELAIESFSINIYEKVLPLIEESDVVVLSDYAKGCLQNISAFIEICHKLSIPCLVDPKSKNYDIYKNAYLITPNFKEFSEAVGGVKNRIELIDKAKELISEINLRYLIITMGDAGAFVMDSLFNYTQHSSLPVAVADVTGAGDTFLATIAYNIALKQDIHESIKIANVAAGISVTRPGTTVVTASDIQSQSVHPNIQNHKKIIQLSDFSSNYSSGVVRPRIVFTNGCFDVLHVGHIRYLQKAKSYGEILVIGLNSDISVRSLKGPNRPINTLDDRSEALSAFPFVDFIISFDELTPIKLIESISPDVLVKGGDYKAEEIVGFGHVSSFGGQVVAVDFSPGHSSSRIIDELYL